MKIEVIENSYLQQQLREDEVTANTDEFETIL